MGVGLHEVFYVEHGLAKETVAALAFDLQQTALNGPNARSTDVAVFGGEQLGVVTHILQHGPQVFHVQQQQAVVIGDLEHQVQHPGLGVVQAQHAGQQQGSHVRNGGAHRVTLFAKHVPKGCGAGHGHGHGNAPVLEHGGQLVSYFSGLTDAGQIAFDVGHEDGDTHAREILGQGLQGHSFTCACGACDQAMAVGQTREEVTLHLGILRNQHGFSHVRFSPACEK